MEFIISTYNLKKVIEYHDNGEPLRAISGVAIKSGEYIYSKGDHLEVDKEMKKLKKTYEIKDLKENDFIKDNSTVNK